jgi:uncharacterized repeat protein (TIGR01451 family)
MAGRVALVLDVAAVAILGGSATPQPSGAGVVVELQNESDLTLTMSHSPEPTTVGDVLTYHVSFHNNGPGNAYGANLTWQLTDFPGSAPPVEPSRTCSSSGTTFSCHRSTAARERSTATPKPAWARR